MTYTEQLKQTGKTLAIGYGLGSIVGLVLGLWLAPDVIGKIILCLFFWALGGSVISMIMVMHKGLAFGALYGVVGKMISSMFAMLCSSLLGSPIGIAIFAIGLMIFGTIALFLVLYLAFCFPMNILYVAIMALVEKKCGLIPENVSKWLDKIVPLVAGIVAFFVCKAIVF